MKWGLKVNISYYGGSVKNAIFRGVGGGSQKTPIYTRGLSKKGSLGSLQIKKRVSGKEGFDTAMYTMMCMQTTTGRNKELQVDDICLLLIMIPL